MDSGLISMVSSPSLMEGRAAVKETGCGPDGRSLWRWEGSGWAQSRGSPICVTGHYLSDGAPPAFRFAKHLPATAVQQPPYQNILSNSMADPYCKSLSERSFARKLQRGNCKIERILFGTLLILGDTGRGNALRGRLERQGSGTIY